MCDGVEEAMRRLAILLLGMVLISSQADARRFKEIPLPDDMKIASDTSDLGEDEAIFIGAWEGMWDENLPSIVVITDIDPKTHVVKGVYGWGKGRNVEAGYTHFTGKIILGKRNNKVVMFEYLNAKISFRVPRRGGDVLKGKFNLGKGRLSEGFFSRTELGTDLAHAGRADARSVPLNPSPREFLGEWCGYWNNSIPGRFNVKEVTEDGVATGKFTSGHNSWSHGFEGEIVNDELTFTIKLTSKIRPELRYQLMPDGTLAGIRKIGKSTLTGVSKRCGDGKSVAHAEAAEEYRAFLGDWCGRWNGRVPNRLTVLEVSEEGIATGIYASPGANQLFKGAIAKGRLRFRFDYFGSNVQYRLRDDGTLGGSWQSEKYDVTILSKRCTAAEIDGQTAKKYRRFLGDWCGYWNNARKSQLIVNTVAKDGGTRGYYVYVHRTYPFAGKIDNNELRFTLGGGAKLRYWFEGDVLKGTWRAGGSPTSIIKSKRCR